MSKKSLPNVDEKIIDTVDVDGTYQAELRKKEERRTYPSKSVLYDRRVNKDRRHRESIDIKI
ncbi:hypothetical protein [Aliivibrio fischeri]|uniref:hypothetical protein n=1 Tax=Aliivibrio fischeri TaxID=668 RepID=UPI00084BD041|nr:hypothetical protein [Aliivibrio fischeri]OED53269.1 hypothetical protein BEI47_05140 [Aliivibrio fischeri]